MDWQVTAASTLMPRGAAVVLHRIVAGELTPETTLPNLEWLANQFAKSRMSMREAIKLLSGKGPVSSAKPGEDPTQDRARQRQLR